MVFSHARLNRLFAADHRCFDLAIDHGVFHNAEFLAGIEDLPAAVATAVQAGPDAIQLGVGQARSLTGVAGKQKPALVLRGDVANVYGTYLPEQLFCLPLGNLVEQALRADAAAVVLNLFHAADKTELYRQCLANIAGVKAECERYAMPLMIEPLVLEPGSHGDYESSGHAGRIAALVRQAAELGADLIKCDPPAEAGEFHRLVEAAGGRPVLARGGGRMPEEMVFARTREILSQGASGIVYGRNIIQHPKPREMTQALMAVVHSGAGVEEAMAILRG
jgi:DhnA family fructose-bisphosphate aldolase class Ia